MPALGTMQQTCPALPFGSFRCVAVSGFPAAAAHDTRFDIAFFSANGSSSVICVLLQCVKVSA